MKIFKRIALGLISILILFAISLSWYFFSVRSTYEGEIQLEGLQEEVTVYFDEFGIPHIYAQNSEDAHFALGYVHAQDRLFQMEMIRRLASGRMSEILGADLIETDRFFRTLGIRDMAIKSANTYLSEKSEPFQRDAHAYLKGLNNFLETGPTPIEFKLLGIPKEPFSTTDIYTTLGYICLGFTGAFKEDALMTKINEKLGGDYMKDWWFSSTMNQDSLSKTELLDEKEGDLSFQFTEDYMEKIALPIWHGSNGWVLSSEKSKSGEVLFANDTHIGFSLPSTWYEAHIEIPGFSFYGNYLAGVPFGVIGHNREISWGMTIFPFDNMDLYEEKLNPENADQVWENDKWVDLGRREEIIKVKNGENVNFDVKISRHGPLLNEVVEGINEHFDKPISMWWTYLKMPSTFLQASYSFMHAEGINDARKAASLIDVIGLNVLFGDKTGNIAWWGCGKIPQRPEHVNARFVLDGASGKDEPLGFYDFSENPFSENPESGFIISANHDPRIIQPENDVKGYYCPDNRFKRIKKRLEEKEKWSLEELKTIHRDVSSDIDAKLAHFIVEQLQYTKESSALESSALGILKQWNGNYEINEIAPTIYTKLIYQILSLCMKDELGRADFQDYHDSYTFQYSLNDLIRNDNSIWWDDVKTSEYVESRDDIFSKAMENSISELKAQLGNDIQLWTWEKVHQVTYIHPIGRQKPFDKIFNIGPYPISGGNRVPNKIQYHTDSTGVYSPYSGPALRILLDFADLENSVSINPVGQSGNVLSKHYDDQAKLYVDGVYRKQMMNKTEIEQKSSMLTLIPSLSRIKE